MDPRIQPLVDKYMQMLSIDGQKPYVLVKSFVGKTWLGLCRWTESMPLTSTISLKQSILGDARTLERVVAHEMVHHRDFLNMTEQERVLVRYGLKPEGHGPNFRQGMAIVNAVMGKDFVTEKSDQAVESAADHDLYLLIEPTRDGRYGYCWAARLSPEAAALIAERKASRGARLVTTRDLQWTYGKARIRKYAGLNIFKVGSPSDAELRAMYEAAGP